MAGEIAPIDMNPDELLHHTFTMLFCPDTQARVVAAQNEELAFQQWQSAAQEGAPDADSWARAAIKIAAAGLAHRMLVADRLAAKN